MDREEVQNVAKIEVHEYFDRYLTTVFPRQVEAMKQYTDQAIERHDAHPDSHSGVERKVSRFIWLLLGGATVIGGGFGAVMTKFASLIP